ncbi:MAG: hypothetical protein AAFQ80_22000 [Cyanobacteria bacterium J06621_8]
MDGINKAKERGVAFGRKKKMTTQQIEKLIERRKSGTLIKTLMCKPLLVKNSDNMQALRARFAVIIL